MTEKLYVNEEVPDGFHFIRYGIGYYDLFNTQYLNNGSYNYYRVYYDFNQDMVTRGVLTVSQYQTYSLDQITTTHNVFYRKDIDSILTCCFIMCFLAVFLINWVTSIIKKGGVFSGLL